MIPSDQGRFLADFMLPAGELMLPVGDPEGANDTKVVVKYSKIRNWMNLGWNIMENQYESILFQIDHVAIRVQPDER